jgi:curli biogenesis system outer membrane secretion channel CsgG
MKRTTQCLLAIALAGSICAAAAQEASKAPAQPRKKRVAIIDFEYGTVRTAVAGLFGTDIDVGRGICDLLVKQLVNDGSYTVVERRMLDKILAEQNFSTSDRANPATAAKIGKILGLDAIIVGSITQFGGETQQTNVGGVGAARGPFGFGGIGHKKSKAIVSIDARLIDVDTAEILAVADGKGESKRESTSLLGGGGSWGGFGAGAVDFGSKNFQETIIGEAVKAAVEQLGANVIAAKAKLQARTVVVEGLVAAVEGDTVVLNVGAKSGVKVGDQLSIERVSKEIKDPATGNVIRRMASKIGVIQVTEVDEVSAVAKIVAGSGFKVGDMAKTVTQ